MAELRSAPGIWTSSSASNRPPPGTRPANERVAPRRHRRRARRQRRLPAQLLLHIADSSITYRSRHLTLLRADLVLDLLLCDETNPRSVGMQFAALRDHVDALPEHAETGRHSVEQRLALKVLTAVRLADVDVLTRRDNDGGLGPLGDLLAHLKTDLFDLSEALTAQYLSHLQTARLRSSD